MGYISFMFFVQWISQADLYIQDISTSYWIVPLYIYTVRSVIALIFEHFTIIFTLIQILLILLPKIKIDQLLSRRVGLLIIIHYHV